MEKYIKNMFNAIFFRKVLETFYNNNIINNNFNDEKLIIKR